MTSTLLIAIGNVARGDDGSAHHVAALLSAAGLPHGVRLLTAVGLDVAMAADVADCKRLIVIDAVRREEPAVDFQRVIAGTAAHSGHAIDAPGLLAVTEALYSTSPEALVAGIASPQMGHTEALSDTAKAASQEAALAILDLVQQS